MVGLLILLFPQGREAARAFLPNLGGGVTIR
jgi:hypothetical protein